MDFRKCYQSIIICIAIAFLIQGLSQASLRPTKPNILLIVSDDHGLDAVGCYGNQVIQTPNIDKLAKEGVRFKNAFCTTASCSASRSVILTGLYNHANGQYGHSHSYHHFKTFENIRSLPVHLKSLGYRTARVGKFHVAPEDVYKFDEVFEGDTRSPVEMADNCRDFISSSSENPFFLYYCTSDPHRSGDYSDDEIGANLFGNLPNSSYPGINEVKYKPEDVIVPDFLPDTPECRAELAQYYQSVSRLDQGVGRLIHLLVSADKYQDTVIVYISDNGIAFPGAKTTVYEPGIHLPCVIRDPYQSKRGIVNNAFINWADIAPTLVDYALGNWKSAGFHGRSFKSVLEQSNPNGWEETFASHTFHEITMYYPMRVIRQKQYKFIWNLDYRQSYPFATDLWAAPTWQQVYKNHKKYFGKRLVENYLHRPEFEIYDLQKDPDEVRNLALSPDHSQLLESFKEKMKKFQKETNDPWIIAWSLEGVSGGDPLTGL